MTQDSLQIDETAADTSLMPHCPSCDATLVDSDRFCPACGTPNAAARLHPRFGPAIYEPPIVVERVSDGNGCPRCDAPIVEHDPYCRQCGMSLAEHRRLERQARFRVRTTPGPDGQRPFRALRALGMSLQVTLGLNAFLAIAITVVAIASVPHYDDAFNSVRIDGSATKWTTPLQVTLAASLLATFVLFLWWFARAYRNLEALGVSGTRRSESMAILSWFIPILNLVLPKEMVDDLWRASDPESLVFSDEWKHQSVPFRIHVWWTITLLAVVTLIATQWVLPGPGQISGSIGRPAAILVLLAHPTLAASSILLLLLVRDVNSRQNHRAELLSPKETTRSSMIVEIVDDEPEDADEIPSVLVHSANVSVSGRY